MIILSERVFSYLGLIGATTKLGLPETKQLCIFGYQEMKRLHGFGLQEMKRLRIFGLQEIRVGKPKNPPEKPAQKNPGFSNKKTRR